MNDKFRIMTRDELASYITQRQHETKLGEKAEVCAGGMELTQALSANRAKFVLLGIPEDIGVRANYGIGGAHTLWEPALRAIMNVQYNHAMYRAGIMVLGAFDFSEEQRQAENAGVEELRGMVNGIDEAVQEVVTLIVQAGKIPIVIGGGHNNAYPILKGVSTAMGRAVNCMNLDAHSDYRAMEGRHSGNGFRYAHHEKYLGKYAVTGLHENYNSPDIIQLFNESKELHFSWYEDIFIRAKTSFYEAVQTAQKHTSGAPTGIELDMDCIEGVLSSAQTPAGITPLQARQYINWCTKAVSPAYLHLTEGAVTLAGGRTDHTTAKLAAYLVTDFIKSYPIDAMLA